MGNVRYIRGVPVLPYPAIRGKPPHFSRPPRLVAVSVFPQNPLVDRGKPELIALPSADIHSNGHSLVNRHFQTRDARTHHPVRPNKRGNFIFEPGTAEFDVVNSHVHATETVKMFERYLGRPIRWPTEHGAPVRIRVNQPGLGGQSYADSDHWMVDLGYSVSRRLHKEVRSSESAEAVAHEVGHLILRTFRPGMADNDFETDAFEESFADMVTMLYVLQDQKNLADLWRETHGSTKRQNLVTKFDEEDGKAEVLARNPRARSLQGFYLRTAKNNFIYRDPATYPEEAGGKDYHALTREPHDFSMIFTGAVYDIMEGMYRKARRDGEGAREAVLKVRDTMGRITARSIAHLPRKRIRFRDGARAMIAAAREQNAGAIRLMEQIFKDRNIFD